MAYLCWREFGNPALLSNITGPSIAYGQAIGIKRSIDWTLTNYILTSYSVTFILPKTTYRLDINQKKKALLFFSQHFHLSFIKTFRLSSSFFLSAFLNERVQLTEKATLVFVVSFPTLKINAEEYIYSFYIYLHTVHAFMCVRVSMCVCVCVSVWWGLVRNKYAPCTDCWLWRLVKKTRVSVYWSEPSENLWRSEFGVSQRSDCAQVPSRVNSRH